MVETTLTYKPRNIFYKFCSKICLFIFLIPLLQYLIICHCETRTDTLTNLLANVFSQMHKFIFCFSFYCRWKTSYLLHSCFLSLQQQFSQCSSSLPLSLSLPMSQSHCLMFLLFFVVVVVTVTLYFQMMPVSVSIWAQLGSTTVYYG